MLLRLLVKPRWLLRHLIVIALCVAFAFLSRWQFHRGERTTGTVQNYGYSVEWLVFAGCVCFGWWKMLQDELHPEGRAGRRGAKAAARAPRSNPWRAPTAEDLRPVAASAVQEPLGDAGPSTPGTSQVLRAAEGEVPAALLTRRRPESLTTAAIDPDDEEVVTYNAWLAEVAARGPRGYKKQSW